MMPQSSRRRAVRLVTSVVALAAAGSLLAGCAEGAGAASDGASVATPTDLVVALSQNPDSLDPGQTGLVGSIKVDAQIFDPLIWRFSGATDYEPGLATSYSVNADSTEYTFKLREGVTFQDGTPFNADAVKATFDHIADPATKSASAVTSLGPYKETDVVDAQTVKVVFKSPYPAFNTLVASEQFGIASPTALKKYGADFGQHPVGTGPFSFVSFTNGSEVKLKKNPDYSWGPKRFGTGAPKLASLTFRVLTSPTSQNNALKTGEVQVADGLHPQDVVDAKKAGKHITTVDAAGMPYGWLINVDKAPTNDPLVRQAIAHAIDRKSIITTLFAGEFDLASSVVTKATPGYAEAGDEFTYDSKKAGKLLDQAGWKLVDGKRVKDGQPLTVDMINIANFGFDDMSALVQSQLAAVGITAKLSDQAFPTVGQTYNQGGSNTASWFFWSLDPNMIKSVFTCAQVASGFNWSHYCDPELDKKIDTADATADPKARAAAFADVFTEINKQVAFIPVYDLKAIYVTNGITGLASTPDGDAYYAGVGK
ncbi:ABC transporter substrate-binding protein [Leifsonia sp. NPDC058230]|uniref:ABC transporter substrate-binding protein n=1 Tax=Leifsonia sp. NPDC058230 TaxID=3346391 RepID=UPI0036DC1574